MCNGWTLRAGIGGHIPTKIFMEDSPQDAQVPMFAFVHRTHVMLIALTVLRLDHIVYDCAPRVNPLWISCYADEDFATYLSQHDMITCG